MLVDIAKDDQVAFEQLYVLVSAPVWGVVLRVVRDPAQSQQVTQEVFADLWRTAPQYDPAMGSALTWVLTLAAPPRGGPGPLAAGRGPDGFARIATASSPFSGTSTTSPKP